MHEKTGFVTTIKLRKHNFAAFHFIILQNVIETEHLWWGKLCFENW